MFSSHQLSLGLFNLDFFVASIFYANYSFISALIEQLKILYQNRGNAIFHMIKASICLKTIHLAIASWNVTSILLKFSMRHNVFLGIYPDLICPNFLVVIHGRPSISWRRWRRLTCPNVDTASQIATQIQVCLTLGWSSVVFALCLLIEKNTYSYPKVTYSYPKVI